MPRFAAVPMILWLATLLSSGLPVLIVLDFLGLHGRGRFDDILYSQLAALLALLAASIIVKPLRPARDAVLIWLAYFIGHDIVTVHLYRSGLLYRLHECVSADWVMLIERLHLLVPAFLMTLVVLGRYRRRDLFLAWGHFSAPVRWSILFPFPVRTWGRLLAIAFALAVILLAPLLLMSIGFDGSRLQMLPPRLPAVATTAIFNALAEEYTSRMLPLAVLIPAVGPRQAIAMTAVHFGIAHFHGQPPGLLGVLLMTYAGWALAKSMIETDGAGWALCLHTFGDLMIFALIAMSHL